MAYSRTFRIITLIGFTIGSAAPLVAQTGPAGVAPQAPAGAPAPGSVPNLGNPVGGLGGNPAGRPAAGPATGNAPVGAAGRAPVGAAGPPPLGAAGPPPLGAAGPPPVGAGAGVQAPPASFRGRCFGPNCRNVEPLDNGAAAPADEGNVVPEEPTQ